MPDRAKVYISLVSAAGIAAMAYAFLDPPWPHDPFRLCTYLLLSLLAATLKLRLPGLTGTMSIGFVLVLLGVSEFTLPETMLIACAGVLVQCLWRAKSRPTAVQVLFNVSAAAISLTLAYGCSQFVRTRFHAEPVSIVLAVATCLYFAANSLLVSGVLSLVKREPLRAVWQQCYLYAFPYYLLGGAVAGLMAASTRELGWKPPLLILPAMGMAFLFYRFYLSRLEVAPVAALPATSLHTVKTRSA
jgi:MASE9 protein